MKKESINYITKAFNYLNNDTKYKYSFESIQNDIDKFINGNINKSKDTLLSNYKDLFTNHYASFQTVNLSVTYKGLNDEQAINKKANNVFMFNAVMNDIFKNVILNEINEKRENKLSFELHEYTYGSLCEGELAGIDESLECNKINKPINNFFNKYGIVEKDADYDTLKNVMTSITSELEEASASADVKRLVNDFAFSFSVMREHFGSRSFLSKYFTPSGLKEWYTLEHAKKTLIEAIPEDYIDDIKFTVINEKHKNEVKDLFDITDSELKDSLEYLGKNSAKAYSDNVVSMKVQDELRKIKDLYKDDIKKEAIIASSNDIEIEKALKENDIINDNDKYINNITINDNQTSIDEHMHIVDAEDINIAEDFLNFKESGIPNYEDNINNIISNNRVKIELDLDFYSKNDEVISNSDLLDNNELDIDEIKEDLVLFN